MKTLIAFLILAGLAAYYGNELRKENAQLKAQVSELAEKIPEEEKAQLFAAKPLWETKVPQSTAKPMTKHNRILCPQCKGEGAVMVRRGTNDVKMMCGLCMGAGKREFDMPSRDEVCPDCGGMGKRIVLHTVAPRSGGSLSQQSLDGSSPSGGFAKQAPTSTSCPRCLGKGHINRPGTQ